MKQIIVPFVLLLLLTACSIKVPTFKNVSYKNISLQTNKQKLLVKRFVEYWHARSLGDMKTAWKYELPYQKYLTTFERYRGMVGPGPKKTELIRIEYKTPDEAIIIRKVYIDKNYILIKKDKWFFVKNNWYHKFFQTIFPPETEEEVEFQ